VRVLVTGSDGLVGSALKSICTEKDFIFLSRSHADLTNYSETVKIFEMHAPDQVIHLAALVGGIGGNLIHSGEYFRNNIQINLNVLEASRKTNVKKLISFMSTCVFPDQTTYPLNIKNLHAGPPHRSNFGYAFAKRMLEVQSRAYRYQWDMNYVVAIPSNIYGPNDNFNITEGHVVPALIHKIHIAKKTKSDLVVWGTGNPLREFVYSHDIAKLILWMLANYDDEDPIILSNSEEISISKLVELIAHKMNFEGKIIFDKSKPDGQMRKPSDNSELLKRNLDFKFTKIENGIEATCNWFLDNFPRVRK
jgi:GDP-L-fucose synthase